MNIKVRLFGLFRIDRFKEDIRSIPPGTSAQAVIDDLQLPATMLGIILINDIHAEASDLLSDGDCLTLLPLLDGG
ncbi:MAG: MoaD/ThiS family protein [Desulfuromusa sp.]|jgi:molybdopterin converting factor small subunit|nr:MoaD/ThiS family protein [Desulfuromusa sp.]